MLSKTNHSSSCAALERPIMRKSVAGIQLTLDNFEFDDDDIEDLGYAAKAGKTMSDIAGSLANQLNHIIKSSNKPKLSLEEMITHMRSNPKLWQEFLKEVNDSKLATNFGIKEVLNKFIHEREEDIVASYRDSSKTPEENASTLSGVAAVASSMKQSIQKRASLSFLPRRPSPEQLDDCSHTPQRMPRRSTMDLGFSSPNATSVTWGTQKRASVSFLPEFSSSDQHNNCSHTRQRMPRRSTMDLGISFSKTTDSTTSGVAAVASSMKQAVKRRTSISFLPKFLSSVEQQNDSSDMTRRISELPRRVTLDLGSSCRNLVKQASRKVCRMSVDSFQQISSRRMSTAQDPNIQPKFLIEHSSQSNDESLAKYEPFPSHKHRGNSVNMDLDRKKATSKVSFTLSDDHSKNPGSELLETWGNQESRSRFVETGEENHVLDRALTYAENITHSFSDKTMKGNSSSSRKLNAKPPTTSIQQGPKIRAFYDSEFHIQKEFDVRKTKDIMPTRTNKIQTSINAKTVKKAVKISIFDKVITPDIEGWKQNENSFTSYFQSNESNAPAELVTLYLD